jgi:hypothetical protein
MNVSQLRRNILRVEAGGFLAVVAVMWLDEILDLPHALFGFQATPVNWVEGIIETVMVAGCAALVAAATLRLLDHLKQLHGLLPVCSHCRRVRDDHGGWRQLEAYVRDHSEAEFSHGICPECLREHYPQYADILERETPAS